jgi:hypothetical protein
MFGTEQNHPNNDVSLFGLSSAEHQTPFGKKPRPTLPDQT